MKSDYSEKELLLIKTLAPKWFIIIKDNKDLLLFPPSVLKIIALDCFIENSTGKAVDSLRRCCLAIKNCDPYRMTTEYDNFIQL